MEKQLFTQLDQARASIRKLGVRLFSRRELRSTIVAAALACFAPMASAVDMSDLGSATDVICLISSYVSGPWLYAIGIVLIIIGAVAIANSESSIGKFISLVLVGLGIASCAIPIVKNHLKINYTCA
ncbi:TrbC/VirB2 family protein [Paraburkholderia sediminicola]|uniref:TrbC/VirB2 family protein n=1 Tax=Paraburkholderia sediminicola TaxID=458836 RepID=UPI0038BA76A5